MQPVVAKLVDPPDLRSTGRSEEVVRDVLADAALFDPVFAAIDDSDPVVRLRAADAVEKVTRQRPDLLRPHTGTVLATLAGTPDIAVRWHAAQLVPRLTLTAGQRSRAVELLTGCLDDGSSIVATSAMQALADLAEEDPGLQRSVVPMIERLAATGTAAIRARGRHLLARLAR